MTKHKNAEQARRNKTSHSAWYSHPCRVFIKNSSVSLYI